MCVTMPKCGLAHIQVLQGDFDEARGNLGALENYIRGGEISKEARVMYPLVYANMYLKQQSYAPAVSLPPSEFESHKKEEKKSTGCILCWGRCCKNRGIFRKQLMPTRAC